MRSMKRILLASALAVGASSLAMADSIVNVKSETVNYADLRLTSQVGIAVLYGRIKGAAERACSTLDGAQLASKSRYRACFDDTLAKAVTAVNVPELSHYYEYKRGLAASNAAAAAAVTVPSVTVVAKSQ